MTRNQAYKPVTTYTVYRPSSDNTISDLTAAEAAIELLQNDGYRYEIHLEDDVYNLFVTKRSVNSYGGPGALTKTVIYSVADNLADAEAEIYTKVINSGLWENDSLDVMTDADYVEMMAEMMAEMGAE